MYEGKYEQELKKYESNRDGKPELKYKFKDAEELADFMTGADSFPEDERQTSRNQKVIF